MLGRGFHRHVLSRRWLTFIVMCLSFALFGVGTLNLFNMFSLNANFIAEHGVMALMEGAARQFVELVVTLMLAMLAYVVFKACEHTLVHGLTHPEDLQQTEEKEP